MFSRIARHHGRGEQHESGQGGEGGAHDRYSDPKWAAELVGANGRDQVRSSSATLRK